MDKKTQDNYTRNNNTQSYNSTGKKYIFIIHHILTYYEHKVLLLKIVDPKVGGEPPFKGTDSVQ